jgi:hypothetical protein
MTIFGKQMGGGRRFAKREHAPLLAQLATLSTTYRAVLVDVSATGARLQGPELPTEGEELYFRVGDVRTIALVRWRRDSECGVQFCEPLPQAKIIRIRREVVEGTGLPPEMRAALDDWVLGLAR